MSIKTIDSTTFSGDEGSLTNVTPPGALNFIQAVTASNDASVILTGFSSTYDSYLIEALDIYGGSSAYLKASVYIDGAEHTGPDYQSSVERRSVISTSPAFTGYSNRTFWAFTGDSIGPSSSNKMATTIRVYNIDSSAKLFTAHGIGHYGGPNNCEAIGANQSATGAMTGMKFFLSSGNIYGTFRLYGLTKG